MGGEMALSRSVSSADGARGERIADAGEEGEVSTEPERESRRRRPVISEGKEKERGASLISHHSLARGRAHARLEGGLATRRGLGHPRCLLLGLHHRSGRLTSLLAGCSRPGRGPLGISAGPGNFGVGLALELQ